MLLYSLISNGKVVLCDTDSPSKSAKSLTGQILLKLSEEGAVREKRKLSFSHDSFVFHLIVENGNVFLCIATEDFGRRRPFAFLEDIQGRFFSTFGDKGLNSKKKHKFQNTFGRTLLKQMDFYSRDPDADSAAKLSQELEQTKAIIGSNVDVIIHNVHELEDVVIKTQELQEGAQQVRDQAKALKDFYWWQNAKYYIVIGLILVGVLWFVAAKACGGFSFPDCKSDSPPEPKHHHHSKKPAKDDDDDDDDDDLLSVAGFAKRIIASIL